MAISTNELVRHHLYCSFQNRESTATNYKTALREKLKESAAQSNVVKRIVNKRITSSKPTAQKSRVHNVEESTSSSSNEVASDSNENPSKLSYENNNLKVTVNQTVHRQEKRFRLQDHLFELKIVPKSDTMPLLSEILFFLHAAFTFIMDKIRKFYNPSDHNIVFMTLIQSPMVNGLNTGMNI